MGKITHAYDMAKVSDFLKTPRTILEIMSHFNYPYYKAVQMLNVATYKLLIYEMETPAVGMEHIKYGILER